MNEYNSMDIAKKIQENGQIVFGKAEIPEVVHFLYTQLPECKIMAFSGPLGAGKTTLIRELLRKCGITEPITSPTFIYVNRYKNDKNQLFYHFDLYRIDRLEDFLQAGFDEYLEDPNSLCFIEWPEVIEPILKNNCCYITLDYHNDKRELRIKKL